LWGYELKSTGSAWDPLEDVFEHDNQPSGSIKDREIIYYPTSFS